MAEATISNKLILHLDMDAFFAAIEQMDNPAYRNQPVIIGGDLRGVVATASYEARVFGIHSAMPIAQAKKLCPHGIFVRGRYDRYSYISRLIMKDLKIFSPIIQQASIDEAYLDISNLTADFKSPIQLVQAIKKQVAKSSGGLTCSIGIAPLKFLAKICSDVNKPNGFCYLPQNSIHKFLDKLAIEKIPGVGKKMSQSLHSYGISTVAQLKELSKNFLKERYGKFGVTLYDRAHGIDLREVHENTPPKSESCEQTFSEDLQSIASLERALLSQAEKIERRLKKHNNAGRTITLKVKYNDFEQITRSKTLKFRINSSQLIYATAIYLLHSVPLSKSIRLLGIGVSGFEPRNEHLYLPGLPLEALLA